MKNCVHFLVFHKRRLIKYIDPKINYIDPKISEIMNLIEKMYTNMLKKWAVQNFKLASSYKSMK
jgi:hypothetical protein